jgi:hypothetical protein
MRSSRLLQPVILTIACSVGLAALSAIFFPQSASAIVDELLSVDELTLLSDVIVVGTVTDMASFWQDRNIYTDVTVSVEQTVKGEPPGTEITVRQLGGTVGDITAVVTELPDFAVGERAVLFLRQRKAATFDVVGGFQGKFPVQNDKVFLEGSYVPLSTLLGRVATILEGGPVAASDSGWSAGTYAALASGPVLALLALTAGGWYARRRWLG